MLMLARGQDYHLSCPVCHLYTRDQLRVSTLSHPTVSTLLHGSSTMEHLPRARGMPGRLARAGPLTHAQTTVVKRVAIRVSA
nr:hypothetical protein BaRGS_031521 [Batillaria attramentaria]